MLLSKKRIGFTSMKCLRSRSPIWTPENHLVINCTCSESTITVKTLVPPGSGQPTYFVAFTLVTVISDILWLLYNHLVGNIVAKQQSRVNRSYMCCTISQKILSHVGIEPIRLFFYFVIDFAPYVQYTYALNMLGIKKFSVARLFTFNI